MMCAPAVWNSLLCECRSAELLDTYRCIWNTLLFDIAYSEPEHLAYCLSHLGIMILYKYIWSTDWMIVKLYRLGAELMWVFELSALK